ncbi:MAG: glycosyltransferase family 1 protein [Deltaproteobacteria bacterium]|nr:MAG: glycosyltransferase family 1 protein [Deltaproteobacteria bacterium]
MRIAVVAACPFPSPQGSQVFAGQMARALARRGHEVHLVTYGQGTLCEEGGVRHHRARRLPGDDSSRSGPNLMKPVLDAMLARLLARLTVRLRFDVLHCHNYEAAVVGLAVRAVRRIPVVYHSHNLMGDELPTYYRGRCARRVAGAAGRLLDCTVPRRADRVVALCGPSAGRLLELGVPPERMAVVPPAVDDDGPAGPPAVARAQLGLPASAFIVGYAGNLDGYQNLSDLASACRAAASRMEGRRLIWLVVTHEDGRRLQAVLEDAGAVDLCRVIPASGYARARLAMEACDVLVLPRRSGSGFPIKLLNYMSLGRPVVVAGCGAKGVTDGVDALVVEDGDVWGFAAALARLASDDRLAASLGGQARRTFLRNYTWSAVLPEIERLYDSVTAANPLFREPGECKSS